MVVYPTFSCGQLYKLFGYKKKLNFDAVINELLYSISETVYSEATFYPSGTSLDPLNSTAPPIIPYRVFKKEKLPQYLAHKSSRQLLYRIEARMRVIELKKAEIKALSWYKISQWFKLRLELSELSSLTIPVKDVFAFLGYRARQMGISLEKLHSRMKNAAEGYNPNFIFA